MKEKGTEVFRAEITDRVLQIVRIARRWVLHYVLIGIIAGLGAVAFYALCHGALFVFLDLLAGYRPPTISAETPLFGPSDTPFVRWALVIVPALGGLLSGLLVQALAPEAEGHGTDAAIDAYHRKDGFIRTRIPYVKMFASAITIGSGGSGGREGPIAQIGAGFGSFLATRLGLSTRERRIMLAAGIAAGVGSIFKAPLAGALFAAEVLYRSPEFESDVIIPAAISSVVSYCVFCLVFGWDPLFATGPLVFRNVLALGPYLVLAFVVTAGAVFYVKMFYGCHRLFARAPIPRWLRPAAGGFLTGCIGFFLPDTLAFGYGFLQKTLDGEVAVPLLLAVGIGKILTTSFSIGSGGSGGVFGPSMVIGGALGGAVGQIFHRVIPSIVDQPASFVIVGMAGFFAAASKAPISTIIMVSEMTGSYHLLLPGLMVCSLAFLLSGRWSIFEKQVVSRLDSPAHRGEFFTDLLENLKVADIFDSKATYEVIQEDMPFEEFCRFFRRTEQHYFPVVDKKGRLTGIFSINDVRNVLFDAELADVVVVGDIARRDVIVTMPSEDINSLLKKFTVRNIDRIPVVRDDDPAAFLGMVSRREVIRYYNASVEEMKRLAEASRN